jgi:hypothetical protein
LPALDGSSSAPACSVYQTGELTDRKRADGTGLWQSALELPTALNRGRNVDKETKVSIFFGDRQCSCPFLTRVVLCDPRSKSFHRCVLFAMLADEYIVLSTPFRFSNRTDEPAAFDVFFNQWQRSESDSQPTYRRFELKVNMLEIHMVKGPELRRPCED